MVQAYYEEIAESRFYGVIKMTLNTVHQWAAWNGIRDYYEAKKDYLQGQLGNPEGPDAPNKKYDDPRVWLRKSEESIVNRVIEAFKELGSVDSLGNNFLSF